MTVRCAAASEALAKLYHYDAEARWYVLSPQKLRLSLQNSTLLSLGYSIQASLIQHFIRPVEIKPPPGFSGPSGLPLPVHLLNPEI